MIHVVANTAEECSNPDRFRESLCSGDFVGKSHELARCNMCLVSFKLSRSGLSSYFCVGLPLRRAIFDTLGLFKKQISALTFTVRNMKRELNFSFGMLLNCKNWVCCSSYEVRPTCPSTVRTDSASPFVPLQFTVRTW